MSSNSHQQYIKLYRDHTKLICDSSCAAMNAPRQAAASALAIQGLPSAREERYKYTNAAEAFSPDYGINLRRLRPRSNPYNTYKCNVPNLSTSLFFVINDIPYPAPDSSRALLPQGVIIDSLCHVASTHPELLEKYYNHAAAHDSGFRTQSDGITLLNTLLAQDGLLIYLPANAKLKAPIQVVNIADARQPMMCVRRVIIVAETGAEGAILFCDHAENDTPCLTSEVIEAYAEKGSRINVYSIEETNKAITRFSTLYAEQAEQSQLSYDSITLTCGHTRNRVDIRLQGENASTELYGAVIADGLQRIDNNILVEHLAPKCTSNMLYKYVLDQQSTGAFAGKVYVAPKAQHTISEQTNANLCSDTGAHAYSQPMLEIYADDVKCNHGSTIGKLDESALLYMRQRGIPEDEAKLLLQHAFINDVLRHVHIEHLQERLSHLVELRFRGELHQCRGCNHCK